jgi:hypothetical protein
MTIISAKDVDQQMGTTIDPNSVPKHNGGDQGVMQGRFLPQSESVVVESGYGRRGTEVVSSGEVPQQGFYGSGTVISLNEAPPLSDKLEPKRPVPLMPGQDLTPAPLPGSAIVPLPPPAPIPPPASTVAALARLGLLKVPKK